MAAGKRKSTRATASADVLVAGIPARVYKLHVQNNGTAGTAGNLELRDATATPGDGGTLRWDVRFGSTDQDTAGAVPVDVDFGDDGLYMPDGIRITLNTVTNLIVWVVWE